MSDNIDLRAEENKRLNKDDLQERREARNFKYRIIMACVLAAIIIGSLLIVVTSGLNLFNNGLKLFDWPTKSVDTAWDILKMSITGLLGFLLGSDERG